jgi:formylglycine-generating enzyme
LYPAIPPDPNKAYFKDARRFVKITGKMEGPFYHHNHDPGLVECPNGDMLAIWYTTVKERGREFALAVSRLRYGEEEWEPASLFWDVPDRNDHAPAMWYDGDRTIYHYVGLSNAATWGPLAVVMRSSMDNGASWFRARLIVPEHQGRNQPVESVFRTREGNIILPCDATQRGGGGTAIHISKDNGLTWNDPGGTIAGIHAGVAQLDDGRLLAFGRGHNIDGRMPKSISDDMGKTWTYSPSGFPPISGGKRLVLLKLDEGPLFLGSFATGEPKIFVTDVSGEKREIRGFFCALSFDDGQTWPFIRPLKMAKTAAVPQGYFSVCQGKNGLIHLISSTYHYVFNLKWIQSRPEAIVAE